jgi:hypothetical protein
MKSPRLKLLYNIGDIKVYEVDGNMIRKELDTDFTNYAQNFDFEKFIPIDELWIDKENAHSEVDFYVTRMLAERRMIYSGVSRDKAIELSRKVEEAERHKTKKFKEVLKTKKDQLKKIKLQKIMQLKDLSVWLVDGEMVRDLFFVDFVEGGHDKVYKFIEDNKESEDGEIWIDDDVLEKERYYDITHELIERRFMAKGWKYNRAHRAALKVEWIMRNIV